MNTYARSIDSTSALYFRVSQYVYREYKTEITPQDLEYIHLILLHRTVTNQLTNQPTNQLHRVPLEKLTSLSRNSPILWIPKFPYRIHRSPSPVQILFQINPINAPIPYLDKLLYYLPSTPASYKSSLSLGLPTQTLYAPPVPHTCYMPRSSFYSWFDHSNKW